MAHRGHKTRKRHSRSKKRKNRRRYRTKKYVAKKARASRHRRDWLAKSKRIDAINRNLERQGLLKVVNGYYYRKHHASDPYWNNGLGGQLEYRNGKMYYVSSSQEDGPENYSYRWTD